MNVALGSADGRQANCTDSEIGPEPRKPHERLQKSVFSIRSVILPFRAE